MKFLLFPIYLFLFQIAQTGNYADVAGEWSGAILIPGQELAVSFTFSYTDGELDGMIDIPQQNAFNLPVEFTKTEADSLVFQFETGTGPAIFRGKWDRNSNEINGNFNQLTYSFPFSIKKRTRESSASINSDVLNLEIPTRAGAISGTLNPTDSPSALVIFLSGSGSQTRDADIAGFKVFEELSNRLYDKGYSTFRYDDRGTGGSQGDSDATLYDLAEDVEDVVRYLKEYHSELFTEIILLGHSQGGLVASIAAKSVDIDGIIFAASPFISGDEVINQQIIKISEAQGIDEEIVEQNLIFQNRIYDIVKTGGDWTVLEEDLAERLEEQINRLPEPQRNALGDMSVFIRSQINRQLAAAKTDWFKSFIEFEPSEYIGSLTIPMLAVFAEKDAQVILDTNRSMAEFIKEEYSLQFVIETITNANHLFQNSNTGLPSEYGMLEREFAEGYIEAIVEWLNGLD